MPDRNPARAIDVVTRIVRMREFIEHPRVKAVYDGGQPVSMPCSGWGSARLAFGPPLTGLPREQLSPRLPAPSAVGGAVSRHGSPTMFRAAKAVASRS